MTLLLQGLSEPKSYGDLVYKFRQKIVGKNPECSDQFSVFVMCYKRKGYNIAVKRQSACLITVGTKLTSLTLSVPNFRRQMSSAFFYFDKPSLGKTFICKVERLNVIQRRSR